VDVSNFRTLGECDFGTIWLVEGEKKVVVNAYQAALYFSVEDFAAFARMVGDAERRFGDIFNRRPQAPAPAPAEKPASNSKIRQFRPLNTPAPED